MSILVTSYLNKKNESMQNYLNQCVWEKNVATKIVETQFYVSLYAIYPVRKYCRLDAKTKFAKLKTHYQLNQI